MRFDELHEKPFSFLKIILIFIIKTIKIGVTDFSQILWKKQNHNRHFSFNSAAKTYTSLNLGGNYKVKT